MKKIIIIALVLVSTIALAGCRKATPLTIWVGQESVEFYTQKMEEYAADYNATHDTEFPDFQVLVMGAGEAAATFLDDPEAGADIFTVAHDNLGKLIAGSSAIAPVTDPALLAQIEADNPDIFLDVIKGSVDGTEYTFGIPYIAQSLVLYYNTEYLSAEQVQSWEGILEAAKAADKQAVSLTGTDGYNNSFILLANGVDDYYTSLELYTDGVLENCFALGDDTVAKLKWGQRFFNDDNGAKRPTEDGWEVELTDEISLSVITGAWGFQAASAALGDNLGIAQLPTFTLTEADAYGTAVAGTTYKSGTFADAKMFVMKKNSEYAEYIQDVITYLSSKEMQEESFEVIQNLPAYKNAATEFDAFLGDSIEAQLARAQVEMFEWGRPQPFGANSKFNVYYYSKGAPDLLLEILENTDGNFSTDAEIYAQLEIVQSLWTSGLRPE